MTPEWSLYLITDRHQVGTRRLTDVVADALRGGVRAVQLREKDLDAGALLTLARELRTITARMGAKLLINGRIDVMLAVDADGVHLRSDGLPTRAVRRAIGPHRFIGVSTHSLDEVARAADEGADFVTFGPVFPTPSKSRFGPPLGPAMLEAVCRRVALPIYAIGGIARANIPAVMATGARGVATISEIMSARDVVSASRACEDAMRDPSVDVSVDHR